MYAAWMGSGLLPLFALKCVPFERLTGGARLLSASSETSSPLGVFMALFMYEYLKGVPRTRLESVLRKLVSVAGVAEGDTEEEEEVTESRAPSSLAVTPISLLKDGLTIYVTYYKRHWQSLLPLTLAPEETDHLVSQLSHMSRLLTGRG
jgi:hypothetical protein